jgi:hypothetical protein
MTSGDQQSCARCKVVLDIIGVDQPCPGCLGFTVYKLPKSALNHTATLAAMSQESFFS